MLDALPAGLEASAALHLASAPTFLLGHGEQRVGVQLRRQCRRERPGTSLTVEGETVETEERVTCDAWPLC